MAELELEQHQNILMDKQLHERGKVIMAGQNHSIKLMLAVIYELWAGVSRKCKEKVSLVLINLKLLYLLLGK